jgi:hypothetical protein
MGKSGRPACVVGIVVMSTTPRSSSTTQPDRRRLWRAPAVSLTIGMTRSTSEPSPSSDERPDKPGRATSPAIGKGLVPEML